jgi:hypothetical protein
VCICCVYMCICISPIHFSLCLSVHIWLPFCSVCVYGMNVPCVTIRSLCTLYHYKDEWFVASSSLPDASGPVGKPGGGTPPSATHRNR